MASRWGSLLSQAVAGVESRLDTILAESEDNNDGTTNTANATASANSSAQSASPAKPAQSNSRASSSTRANDRLQARLAKAMAAKSAPATADSRFATASPRSSSDIASRSSTDRPRELPDRKEEKPESLRSSPVPEAGSTTESPDLIDDKDDNLGDVKDVDVIEASNDDPIQLQHAAQEVDVETRDPAQPTTSQNTGSDAQICNEIEQVKAQHQEEVREYVERIDSLQSKLQYMSKNAADAAKKTASAAPSGSTEKKLAEQDERIALLMEEGQKLAGAEQQYRTTIKKLRGQLIENEKQLATLGQVKDKAIADAQALRSRLRGGEEKEKRQQETLKATTALQREIDTLRRDKESRDETIRRLEQEASAKAEQAAAANAELLKKAIDLEHEKQKDLEHINASLKAECDGLRDKARLDDTEWSEKLERATERGRSVEAELRVELAAMENKLENMRVAAEEATSSSGGEAQVKLFRQIETLQSQYTSARANWQGIEASLMAKSTGLEKEKDEAQRRESEMRKRARDGASRCRALEDELQDASQALATAQHELEACRDQLSVLRNSSKATETALEETRAELEKEKRLATRELSVEGGEPRQWAEGVRPVSPLPSVSRTFSSDMIGLSALARARRIPTPGSIPDSPAEIYLGSRRPPPLNQPLRSGTMSTTDSTHHMPSLSSFESPMEAPRLMSPLLPSGASPDNGVTYTAPSSPGHLAQDMVSVSTVAAGPSVQLVERMSAAIRRLEAEKVTAKEEMARVCAQRDEARGDIATLMKEMEEAKSAALRVPQLEKEVEELDARYQTTLELLGEKSELVDELRADVEDVKTMYRELVERAVK